MTGIVVVLRCYIIVPTVVVVACSDYCMFTYRTGSLSRICGLLQLLKLMLVEHVVFVRERGYDDVLYY